MVFLRRIVPGGTDKSYGIHVAKLAGLPGKVVERAEKLLEEYTQTGGKAPAIAMPQNIPNVPEDPQPSLFGDSIRETLKSLDVMTMTPLEALNTLYELQKEAKREGGMAE